MQKFCAKVFLLKPHFEFAGWAGRAAGPGWAGLGWGGWGLGLGAGWGWGLGGLGLVAGLAGR